MGRLVRARGFITDMKLVQESMNDRGEHQPRDADQCESAVESVKGSEQFAGGCFDGINGTHTAENHRGVEEGIDPRQALEKMVPAYAGDERAENYDAGNAAPSREPEEKQLARQQWLVAMFKVHHADISIGGCIKMRLHSPHRRRIRHGSLVPGGI